jgi:TPR repeat protein
MGCYPGLYNHLFGDSEAVICQRKATPMKITLTTLTAVALLGATLLSCQVLNAQDEKAAQQIPTDVLTRLREGAKAGNAADQYQLAKYTLSGQARSPQVSRLLADAEWDLSRLSLRVQGYPPMDEEPGAQQAREKFKSEQEKFKKLTDSIEQKETTEALDLLNSAATRKDVDAILYLSSMYSDGKRIAKDGKRAFELDKQAADLSSGAGMANVGYDYGKGEGVEKDVTESVKWLEKGAAKGNLSSCYWLACVLADGGWNGKDDGHPRDLPRAYALGRALQLVSQPRSRASQWGAEVLRKARQGLEPDQMIAAESEGEREAKKIQAASGLESASADIPRDLTDSAKLTKDQWKKRFGQLHPVFAQVGVVQLSKAEFTKICGEPNRTQTVGDTVFWYYQCKDGTIQFELHKGNLLAGIVAGKVNDF